jgi:hypothetical protein
LIELLPYLSKQNVTTIYLEGIRDDYQDLVDTYLSPTQVAMPG